MDNIQVLESHIKEARYRLWSQGILYWKLDPTQRKLYDFFHGNKDKTNVINASRRLGKSFFLIILALEQCIKHPKSIVKYIQPTKDMIRENLNPDFEIMLEDCPLELRPKFMTAGNVWVFPNGSRITLAGTDGKNYNKLRGSNADLCLVDEAGFCDDLKHIINSILIPTTLITKGRIVLSSTTPPDPDHEFVAQMENAAKNGTLIRKTILDAVEDSKNEVNPRINENIVADIIKSMPNGIDSQEFRTEFLCELIFNSTDAVVPEFTKQAQEEIIVEWPRPMFYDRYVAMDVGFADLTFLIFGFYDYDNAVLAIEDEIILQGKLHEVGARNINEKVRAMEAKLWKNRVTGEQAEPHIRVSDNNLILLQDLLIEHGLHFMPTEKHNKEQYINKMRDWIREGRLRIHPRCINLISHLKTVAWDKQRKDFKKHPDGHHYDGVAALMYLVRNIDENKNPYPAGYKYAKLGKSSEVFVHAGMEQSSNNAAYEQLKKMFEPRSSYRRKLNK
jgi:terminase large subunit-like protein